MTFLRHPGRAATTLCLCTAVAACSTLDLDLRDTVDGGLDTSAAAQTASGTARPRPDANGLITHADGQVAVARRGDTVADVARRAGIAPAEMAAANGLAPEAQVAEGTVLAMPRRVTQAPAGTDVAAIAGAAIDRAAAGGTRAVPVQPGPTPVQHRVARGETAFSIARLYGVSVGNLADWNGLGGDLALREGQTLLIPIAVPGAEVGELPSEPGAGTAAPPPPSAARALPETVEAATLPESPALDQFRTEASEGVAALPAELAPAPTPTPAVQEAPAPARLAAPVTGPVLRPFGSGNEGIDFAAPAGTPVAAAEAGEVAAITRDTDQVPILVLRHSGGLLTVYANIANITVGKGDRVSRGQRIATVGPGSPSFLHFEVRRGFEAVDPAPLLR
jgi:murein DD-endopeptidase MepM/ murein hydrolase activator NlpD